jgi:hypothetical protein
MEIACPGPQCRTAQRATSYACAGLGSAAAEVERTKLLTGWSADNTRRSRRSSLRSRARTVATAISRSLPITQASEG